MKRPFPLLLLFLILITGLGGCSAALDGFTEEYQLRGASRLRVITKNGSVKVTGWQENYLRLRATWMVQGETENGLLEYGRNIKVIPDWQGDLLELTVSYPSRPPYIHSASASLGLEVPEGIDRKRG